MGKISNFEKFRLVLWKNYILQRNHIFQLICEVFTPIICALLIVYLRLEMNVEKKPPKYFKELPIDDLRMLIESKSFLQKSKDEPDFSIAFSPENKLLSELIIKVQEKLGLGGKFSIGYANSQEMENALKSKKFLIAIEFDDDYVNLREYPIKFSFKLRFPSELRTSLDMSNRQETWETYQLYPKIQNPGPRNPDVDDDGVPAGYFREAFIPIQHAISMAFIELRKQKTEGEEMPPIPQVVMRRLPYAEYTQDAFLVLLQEWLPLLLLVSFVGFAVHITMYVAIEKERQLKEIMKMMGISNWIHWLAWFIRSIVVVGITLVVLVPIYKFPFKDNVAVFTHSSWTIILMFFFIYCITIITFSFMISVLFKRAAIASALVFPIFFLTWLPVKIMDESYNAMGTFVKAIACLDFNIGMSFAIRIICRWEGLGEGAHWRNLYDQVNEDDHLSLGLVFFMMLLASIIYMLICIYVEQVSPGEFGVPKKWNFFWKREFWTRKANYRPVDERLQPYVDRLTSQVFEPEPKNKRVGIEIRGLKKRYGARWVVKGITLNLYEDYITVLLGHNGAGKTTTIAMLTGMIWPTAGTAKINGYNIRTDTDDARASMGICPQINVLFDDMSVANHLVFFSKLRGLKGEAVKTEVERYLQILQLKSKANDLPATLSGGLKRKLTLCTALCGGAKVVLCDEPSSGMDPSGRHQLWELLQAEKNGRTILLTTHFMDEADVLGDRVAIMCAGEVKCYGSPFFLKKRFGSGYRLICTKNENCNVDNVTEMLANYVPNIEPESEIGTELTYRLPDEYADIFGKIFDELENGMTKLGLNGFGIGIPSMEEVFMNVGAETVNPNWLQVIKSSASSDLTSSEISFGLRPRGGADKNIDEKKRSKKNDETDSDSSYFTTGEQIPFNSKISLTDDEAKTQTNLDKPPISATSQDAMPKEIQEKVETLRKMSSKESLSGVDDQKVIDRRQPKRISEFVIDDKGKVVEKIFERPNDDINKRKPEDEKINFQGLSSNLPSKDKLYERLINKGKRENEFQQQRFHLNTFENESQMSLQLKGKTYTFNQWQAMFYKKAKYTWQNKFIFILQNLIGILLAIAAGSASKSYDLVSLPPLTFRLTNYSTAITFTEQTSKVLADNILDRIRIFYTQVVVADGAMYRFEEASKTDGKQFERFIMRKSQENQVYVNKMYLTAATFDIDKIVVWFNNQPLHMAPLALNLLHNGIARALFDDEAEILVTNYPMPFTIQKHNEHIEESESNIIMSVMASFVMAFISPIYAILIIKENSSRCKLLQFVHGVHIGIYWLSHFLWDLVSLMITMILMFIVLSFFHVPGYTTFQHISLFFALTFIFCAAVLPFTYLVSGLFKEPISGFAIISLIYCFSGLALFVLHHIIMIYADALKISKFTVHSYFLLFLNFAFANGWQNLHENIKQNLLCKSNQIQSLPADMKCKIAPNCCTPVPYLAWADKGIMQEMVSILLYGILSFILLFCIDYGFLSSDVCNCKRPKKQQAIFDDIDEDVRLEKEKVKNFSSTERAEYFLILDNLTKYFGNFLAVDHISLCSKGKECFGLLGVNGAGKTTTFRMLTGDIRISSGNAYVRGLSLEKEKFRIFRKVGYCPQFDALLEDLTGRDLLFIFCLLRGIPKERIKSTTEQLAKALGFKRHIDKRAASYSGGIKRKLSVAIAIVGNPWVIYLDEPTTGLDPAARRQLWNIICLIRDYGKLIVLTSHSMDECEALCTRLAIMVNGQLQCIGSAQHLKNKFSKGIILKIQAERITDATRPDPGSRLSLEMQSNINKIKEAILEKYPNAIKKSQFQSLITFYIPLEVIKWSEIFTWMQDNRRDLMIEDYSITQTSLEEIFLELAQKQTSDTRKSTSKKCY